MGIGISIHALCEEGDGECIVDIDSTTEFLSTPSARRATRQRADQYVPGEISIHALCEEGDQVSLQPVRQRPISIHALCEEGDAAACWQQSGRADFYPRPLRGGRRYRSWHRPAQLRFLSTPSARRATLCALDQLADQRISIHALCEEGDPMMTTSTRMQPRFLSTPSARRATLIL